ncbi:HXXEE domain-containing protein (plasmid) [Arthrobacter agilis]|uniref:HXXEE domain-containing protein n=1 Tax=Arthrobacter agilis TaxID=37921 RepID=UPI0023671AD7|nr:HXXEE domain-containing protein [Arthrobacter agilis]WDF35273.1 HXXEE domain-containing protein [Arthrobacter agilis]
MKADQSAIRSAVITLLAAWLVHDIEEACTLPATSKVISARLGTPRVQVSPAQSTLAIALMGLLVTGACTRGIHTSGDSRFFRLVLAGLEAHVLTHVVASVILTRYTAGLITAPLVMLPGARTARAAVRREGTPLTLGDTVRGTALMFSAALTCHLIARVALPSPPA